MKMDDIVICIDNTEHEEEGLTLNKEYRLLGVKDDLICIVNDNGNPVKYAKCRFKLKTFKMKTIYKALCKDMHNPSLTYGKEYKGEWESSYFTCVNDFNELTKYSAGTFLINETPEALTTQDKIKQVCEASKDLLLYKNEKYGDSALNPIKIFSKQDATNSLFIRLDDKLSRIKNSEELRKNDCSDLIGYLVLLCIEKGWTDFSEFKD